MTNFQMAIVVFLTSFATSTYASSPSLRGLSSDTILQYGTLFNLKNNDTSVDVLYMGWADESTDKLKTTHSSLAQKTRLSVHHTGDWTNSMNECVRFGDIVKLEVLYSSTGSNFQSKGYASGCRTGGNEEVHVRGDTTSAATTFQWIMRSELPDNKDGDRDTVDNRDGECITYADEIILQNNWNDSFWLTGARSDKSWYAQTINYWDDYNRYRWNYIWHPVESW